MQKKHLIITVVLVILALVLPLIWLKGDYLYISEESNFANYQNIVDKNLFSWNEKENYGLASGPGDHTMVVPNGIFYKVLSEIGLNNHYIQIVFLQIFLLCSLLAVSYLLRVFTDNGAIILAGSLLYIFNHYFASTIFYSAKMFQLILMPLFFLFLYRFLKTRNYKYAVYNFLAFFLLQGIFCNLPQLVTTVLVYIIAVFFFIASEKISIYFFIKNYFVNLLSFFVLLTPIFIYQGLVLSSLLNNFDEIKTSTNFKAIGAPLTQIFQLRGAWWEYTGHEEVPYERWLFFYDNIFVILHSFAIFALLIFPLFSKKVKVPTNSILFLFFLVSILFASGSSFMPEIYLWFYNNFPVFYIFRESYSKFMPLVLFLMVILFSISIDNIYEKIKDKNKNLFIFGVFFIVMVGSIPFFSSDFFDRTNSGWKKIFIKLPEYWNEYSLWSSEHKDSYVLPLPFLTKNHTLNYKWYDEDLGNSNARVYNVFGNSNFIGDYYNQYTAYYKILKIFDEEKNFNFVKLGTVDYLLDQRDVDEIKIQKLIVWESGVRQYFEEDYLKNFGGEIYLYKTKPEFYLPHFYTPQTVITTTEDIDTLPEIVSQENYNIRSAIYLNQQEDAIKTVNSTPIIEYKKINPTKYRVILHQATGSFPLVFSESFHDGWNTYLVDYKKHPINFNESDYRILDGNEEDQANIEELKGFIEKGYISSLGDLEEKNIKHTKWENNNEVFDYNEKYKIDFISKNFQDTIQNDNLERGKFYETWLEKPIDNNENHSVVNGYANSWTINPNEICVDNPKCVKNADGTYDLELIVEFWPQRLFYIGAFVSSITLFGCLVYLVRMHTTNKCRKDV